MGSVGATQGPAVDHLQRLLAQITLPFSAAAATRLLPVHLPRQAEAIQTLMHRLAAAEGAGGPLGIIVQLLADAQADGVSARSTTAAAAVVAWLVGPHGAPEAWKLHLRSAETLSPEAVLSRVLRGAESQHTAQSLLQRSPEWVLQELAADGVLADYARRSGRGESWRRALATLADRTNADRLMALHGLASPYRFIELPMASESGWRHAQLHLMAPNNQVRSLALDIESQPLGSLWFDLTVTSRNGRLVARVVRPQTRAAISAAAGDLHSALARAGFPDVAVSVEAWDGDRIGAAVDLFRAYRSVEVRT